MKDVDVFLAKLAPNAEAAGSKAQVLWFGSSPTLPVDDSFHSPPDTHCLPRVKVLFEARTWLFVFVFSHCFRCFMFTGTVRREPISHRQSRLMREMVGVKFMRYPWFEILNFFQSFKMIMNCLRCAVMFSCSANSRVV